MTKLPNGWSLSSVGKLCTPVAKVDPVSLGRKSFMYVDIGSLEPSSSSLENVIQVPTANAPGRARQLIHRGDSIFATVRPYMKKVAFIPKEFDGEIASTGFCVLRPIPEKLNPKFLFYFLLSDDLLDQVLPLQRGVSYPAIRDNYLKNASMPVPSIDEQHKIVELLEDHLSRLDAALADVIQGQKKIRQFRRSFLQDTFIEREGSRPCNLGEVVEIKTGKIDANRAVPDGKYPFFTCAREISRIDDAPFNGKVVLVAGNGDLNVKYYEGKFNAYQRTYILKSKSEEILFPKYLFWFMEHYIFELRTLAIGTTIKYIKLGNLMDAKMLLPAVNIQKQIVLEIERSLSFVEKSEETFGKLTRESKSLRRALLNSAFSGELTNEVLHV